MLDTPVQLTTLDNGIRIVTEQVPHVQSVALGLRVDVGARDEPEELAGITHLLEHMVFKGTERRTARQIAEEMDAVGGQLDAYTTKEYTGYAARVLPEHMALAMDVLSDMLRRSLIEPNELELERGVILEEYKSLEDSPEDWVHEVYSRSVWPDHPLGRPVIGYPEVIRRVTREQLLQYLAQYYVPSRLIWSAAGNVEHERFVGEVARQWGDLHGTSPERVLCKPETRLETTLVARKTEQAHFCLGLDGLDETHPDRWIARVLNLILGGGMSSRLFQEVREKRGLCYSIAAELSSYREGGLLTLYADTSPGQMEEVRDLCLQELRTMARSGVTEDELKRSKDQVRASLLLSLDDVGSRMNRLGRSLLFHGRVIPPSELMHCVDVITLEDCARVAGELFGREQVAFTAIGPFKKTRRR